MNTNKTMAQYINKDALVAEIEKLKKRFMNQDDEFSDGFHYALKLAISFLDNLEVKEEVECKRPEYSYSNTIYQRGEKHRWNIGDILAYYYNSSDCEGEHILGQIVDVKLDEEQDDWFYTFENGRIYYEEELLENDIYVKAKKK